MSATTSVTQIPTTPVIPRTNAAKKANIKRAGIVCKNVIAIAVTTVANNKCRMLNWKGFNTSCPHVQWQNGTDQRGPGVEHPFVKTDHRSSVAFRWLPRHFVSHYDQFVDTLIGMFNKENAFKASHEIDGSGDIRPFDKR